LVSGKLAQRVGKQRAEMRLLGRPQQTYARFALPAPAEQTKAAEAGGEEWQGSGERRHCHGSNVTDKICIG
jgi:hypothetical protein